MSRPRKTLDCEYHVKCTVLNIRRRPATHVIKGGLFGPVRACARCAHSARYLRCHEHTRVYRFRRLSR